MGSKRVMNGDKAVVFRLGHLGDVVLATGVLEWWRRSHGLSFVFVTRPGNARCSKATRPWQTSWTWSLPA
ncbi:hypothetical protein [Salidesulfovibrio brasiliensis]|uniref:hypothetical protein n=1 Tax=Salidesulfovibrio brasiliensis TaxID=221711 RepID=UPI001FE1597E|nr:hypothetical protein [Salidesulfovibrio brasiliensis]